MRIIHFRHSCANSAERQEAFDEQAWLLIAILKPEPHKLARDNNQMHKIGKMAEAFRMRF